MDAEEAKDRYEKRPPKNRVNFAKLGIASPFRTDWCAITQPWSTRTTSGAAMETGMPEPCAHVVRDAARIRALRRWMTDVMLHGSSDVEPRDASALVAVVRLHYCYSGSSAA